MAVMPKNPSGSSPESSSRSGHHVEEPFGFFSCFIFPKGKIQHEET